jgi:protein-S-isoprenylcysteine O-methyltransferase Ste14
MTMSRAALFVVIQFVLFIVYAVAYVAYPFGGELLPVGAILVLISVSILALSFIEHMRRNAAPPNVTPTPKQDAALVETGLYKWIRHPIYSAVILGVLGSGLAHGHIVPLLMTIVFIVFFGVKARYEESMLRQVYPQYADYMKRTGRFIPGVNFV